MSFGATFEDSDASPDDEPRVAASATTWRNSGDGRSRRRGRRARPAGLNLGRYQFVKAILRDIEAGALMATEDSARGWRLRRSHLVTRRSGGLGTPDLLRLSPALGAARLATRCARGRSGPRRRADRSSWHQ